MPALLIFLGGGLGAVTRWGLSVGVEKIAENTALHRFPWGILACNLLGCFAIGALFGLFPPHRPGPSWVFPFLVTGFLGGFTTFSAFGKDTHQLFTEGFAPHALANILASTIGGVILVYLGFRLTHSTS
ncbi:MAG: fluoride efflux transporter CrcB [Verrucomicrobiota bacterium]